MSSGSDNSSRRMTKSFLIKKGSNGKSVIPGKVDTAQSESAATATTNRFRKQVEKPGERSIGVNRFTGAEQHHEINDSSDSSGSSRFKRSSPILDADRQQVLINADSYKSFLVQAPPGSGKTHCLVERLTYLVGSLPEGLNPDSITVLSFTRAVVKEIQTRIRNKINMSEAPYSLAYVNLRTFDSYATWILNDGDYDLQDLDYDDRIELFNDELKQNRLVQNTGRIDQTRWLIVDEIQDLVSPRNHMVTTLMNHVFDSGGSVVLLGDSNQSINDYQNKGMAGLPNFIEQIKNRYRERFEFLELNRSYRYENNPSMKRFNEEARRIMDNPALAVKDRVSDLINIIPGNDTKICLEQLKQSLTATESVAVLCRSNIQVQQMGEWLRKNGITSCVLRDKRQPDWPCWLAILFSSYRQKTMSLMTLEKRYSRLAVTDLPLLDDVKQFLERNGLLSNGVIDLGYLEDKIQSLRQIPSGEKEESVPTISTIHRAKGLEYDKVIVLEPSRINSEEELRVFYVALSRAKEQIHILERNDEYKASIREGNKFGKIKLQGYHYIEGSDEYIYLNNMKDISLSPLEQPVYDTEGVEICCRSLMQSSPEVQKGSFNIRRKNSGEYCIYYNLDENEIPLMVLSRSVQNTLDQMFKGYFDMKKMVREDVHYKTVFIRNMVPSYYKTIIHPQDNYFIRKVLGESRFLRLPVFEGYYKLENLIKPESDT